MTANNTIRDESSSSSDGEEEEDSVNNNQHDEPINNLPAVVSVPAAWSAEKLAQASYKDLGSPVEVEERFFQHIMSNETCLQSVRNLLSETSSMTRDYSVTIDAFDLLKADPILGQLLLRYPGTLLPLLEDAIVRAQTTLLKQQQQQQQDEQQDDISTEWMVKGLQHDSCLTRVHARLVHLPPSCVQTSFSAASVGKILQVSGTVVRTRPVQMYESTRVYQCSFCQKSFAVHADWQDRYNALPLPTACPNPDCKNNSHGDAGNNNNQRNYKRNYQRKQQDDKPRFTVVEGGSVHADYQEIKLQESASSSHNNIPRSLLVKLQNDLVDSCQPGDEVVIVGTLLAQWQSVAIGEECSVGLALSAQSVRVLAETSVLTGSTDPYRQEFEAFWGQTKPEQAIRARDFICQAVCPKLYGMKMIKLALLLTLIGGMSASAADGEDCPEWSAENIVDTDGDYLGPVPFSNLDPSQTNIMAHHQNNCFGRNHSRIDDARHKHQQRQQVQTRRRHQSHLLLVGDPGTGKSQFLRFAASLSHRSVLTTGVGTTSAGLTCAAVRDGDGREFSLEAGALVLADKGVCCIDEFGCIRDQDRTTIHEAMEQQTLSVAKAGIVCKLNCRATIIAVMNPRDCLYDNHASLAVNTGLGTPLLSRFDLIFKLIDSSDAERDSNVTTYLLQRAIQGNDFDADSNDGNHSHKQQHQNNHHSTGDSRIQEVSTPWKMDKLRAYITFVRDRFQPAMSDEAALLLERHYEDCRSMRNETIPVTVRFLESLIRLSQAHARLMFRSVVTIQDAVAVLEIMECTAFCRGGFDGTASASSSNTYCDPMTVDFRDHPDDDFVCYQYRALERYDLRHCLTERDQQRAQDLLHDQKSALAEVPRSWNEVGEKHDRHPTMTQDHYGRYQYDLPAPPSKRFRR